MSKFWATGSSPSSSDEDLPSSSSSAPKEQNDLTEDKTSDSKHVITENDGKIDLSAAALDKKSTYFLSLHPDLAWQKMQSKQIFTPVIRNAGKPYDPNSNTRIVCISDTHGCHRNVRVPRGDALIHAGDFTNLGEVKQIGDLSAFFGESGYEHVICIAGNHDVTFQPENCEHGISKRFRRSAQQKKTAREALRNCIYLEDSACTACGVNFYGSPWQPWFWDWAFNLPRGAKCREVWERIPTCTDVLITHGPPLGRGDLCSSGNRAGCVDMLREIQNRIKPRLHIFGHIHEGYGVTSDGTTLFVNASIMSGFLSPVNPPIVIDLPHDSSLPPVVVEPKCDFSPDELIAWLDSHGNSSEKTDEKNTYQVLIPYFQRANPPVDGNFLMRNTFKEVCDRILLCRDRSTRNVLRDALSHLRAESF